MSNLLFRLEMTGIINIPLSLIKGYRGNKADLEMLACAILVKHYYQNSCVYGLKITKVMELFGVAHKKAHKLIELLKTHELFIYNEKNDCLFAKSFKSKDEKHYGNRRKYTAIADYCRKLQVHDGMTLRELVRELRNTLLMNVIHANEQDGFIVSGNKQTATKPNVQRAIPQRKLAKSIGMSKSSASRYINRMAKENSISFSGVVFGPAKSVFGGQFVWTVYGRVYSILNRHLSESFKNVIYNYHYPYTLQAQTSAELDGKW